MKIFKHSELEQLIPKDKINLINSLPGLKSVNLIGTKSQDGDDNLAIFSSVIHMGSNPPLIGFIHRPKGEFSHTLKNIEATGYYTINNVHEDIKENAHQTSEKFESNISEFEACHLTPVYIDHFQAPFVTESKVKYGMKMIEIIPIKHNGTFLIIGEVQIITVDKELLNSDYIIDHVVAKTTGVTGVDEYVGIRSLNIEQ